MPACIEEIAEDAMLPNSKLIIYGYRDTYAQQYADIHKIRFVARYESPKNIIDYVSEYTSDELYNQFSKIMESEYSMETKHKLYQELFTSYGIIDVLEGTQYLSNTTDKRRAYLMLTTDDYYTASLFRNHLNSLAGIPLRAVLLADGLIFNSEVNDWINFETYLESDYPGVSKYKTMLYDFMDATSNSIEIQSNIKLVSDLSKNVTGAAKIKAEHLINELNKCETLEQQKALINSAEALDVWLTLAEEKDVNGNFIRDNNGSIELTYKLDSSSGFGQFAKAMGYAADTISIVNMAITDAIDLLTLDSKLAIYSQYSRFLKDIVSNTEGVPYQLRWAASQILDELHEGYYNKIQSIAFEILDKTQLDSVVLEIIIGETASKSISSWLSAIGIEAFFINKVTNIGDIVKNEACVEGYAALSSAFAKNLQKSKQVFLSNKTEENAWDFYYNYNILYRLRYKGEQASLKMHKVEGYLSYFSDFGYSDKASVVKETLKLLEDECEFRLDTATSLPESCQYAAKAVIKCPVNVDVYAEDGTLIAKLTDGSESDIINEYGRFSVVYDYCLEDYVKIICLNNEQNATIQLTGIEDGLVNMEFSQLSDPNKIYEFSNVPIAKGNIIKATIEQLTIHNKYDIDKNGDTVIDDEGFVSIKQDAYIPIESMKLTHNELALHIGESIVLGVVPTPINATIKDVSWISANPSVAIVADGKVTAIAEGNTNIYCVPLDDSDKIITCKLNVKNGMDSEIKAQQVESISLLSTSTTLNLNGDRLQLKAIIHPENAVNKILKWSSDNESVATVDSEGWVTAVGEGIATITAESTDGSSKSASCAIKVERLSVGDNHPTVPDDDSENSGLSGGSKPDSGASSGNFSGGSMSDGNTTNGSFSGDSTSNDNPSNTIPSGGSLVATLSYYIVDFDPNGGKNLSRTTMTLLNDDNLGILPKVQRKNYTFNGWYTQKTDGTKVSSSTVLNAGTTLFAQWKKVDKPSKVKSLILKSAKSGELIVSFPKVVGVKGYEIDCSTSKKFSTSSTRKTVLSSANKTLKKLKSGKKYYIRVRSYKLDSTGIKVYGSYSTVKSIKVK